MKLENRFLSFFAVIAFCVAATTAWAGQRTLESDGASVRMPQSGTDTLTIGNGVQSFEISRCSEECDDAVLVLKAPTGLRIQLGPLFGELLNNPLQAYDGADINAPLLFSRTVDAQFPGVSVDAPYGRYVSSGEYMKVVYKKGESDFFTLNAIVVNPNETHSVALCSDVHYNDDHCTSGSNNGGTVSSTVNSATVNTQVSLNATPNTGKLLNRVHAWDKFGSIAVTGGTWYTSNDATFTMPAMSVWFEAFYATALTAEGGLTIEKPKNEVLEVNIPDNVESFTVNGWIDLSCSSMAPGKPLILRAPEGKHLQVLDSDGKPHDRGVFYRGQSVPYDGVYDDPVAAGAATLVGSVSYSNVLTLIDYPASASDDVRTIVRLMDESEVNNTPHSVKVINKGECTGNVSSGDLNLGSVVVGTPVSMTVNPDEGCALNDVYVTIRSEKDTARVPMTGGSWFAGNDFSFTMPFEDVYVVVNYAEKTNFTVSNDIHIDMPERGTLSASIPDYVSSFYINDPKMQYDGVLVLTAPEDYKILLYGYADDYEGTLDIYDGSSTGATLLSSPRGVWTEVESSGNTMTLYLKGRPVFGNLTVELVYNPKYEISIIPYISNGTISVADNLTSAKAGDVVTLIASPDEGYELAQISVGWWEGSDWHDIDVTGGSWLNNQAQFVMPASDVVVYANFAHGYDFEHYVAIPKSGSENIEIPKGVESFTIVSDLTSCSIYNCNSYGYSDNSDGTLTLTAPKGYVFYLDYNSSYFADEGDYLDIFDGIDVNADKLITMSYGYNGGQYIEKQSSGRNLTLRFKSNESGSEKGAYITVYVDRAIDSELEIPASSSSSVVVSEGGNYENFIYISNEKGSSNQYFNNSDGTLTLTAPEGYGLNVTGYVYVNDEDDVLQIYDGVDVNAQKILEANKHFYNIYSSGRSLTFRFKSNDDGVDYGVDLYVQVLKNSGSSAVAIYEPDEGRNVAVIDGSYGGENETEAVNIPSGITVNSVQFTRDFPVGVYSTMVLPFSVNTAYVEGLKAVLYYNGIKTVDEKSSIRMKVLWAENGYIKDKDGNGVSYKHTTMNANTPYLLLMNNSTFTIADDAYPLTLAKTESAETSIDGWTFRGTWKYKKWGPKKDEDHPEISYDPETGNAYGFAASKSDDDKIQVGDFVRVGEGASIRPMRAYLVKTSIKAALARANGAYVKRPSVVQEELPEIMSIIIDDEDGNGKQTTVIGHFNTRTGEIRMNRVATDRVFDIKGRNVGNKANKARGAYYGKTLKK